MMGVDPESFDRMTCAEIMYVHQGFARRLEQDYHTAMNIERWGCYAVMSAVADLKGMSAYELLPLPWDERTDGSGPGRKRSGRLSKTEISRRRAEAMATIKQLERYE